MNELQFAKKIATIGGTAYLVGGSVRDRLLGKRPKDRDYLLCGVSEKDFTQLFPRAKKVGRAFPVYLLYIGNRPCEVAFARRDKKTGTGYKGFEVDFSPEISVQEDLYRRDLTVNSMAFSILEQKLIDPFGGEQDLKEKLLRATSVHFCEDPVRALRAARFAAQLKFDITADTVAFMNVCKKELAAESKERILLELEKALSCRQPSIFFRALQKAELLDALFPEIYALIGKTQPAEYHPEGDAFEHTMLVLDKVARYNKDTEVRFAALMHDIGKGGTAAAILPHHYGHEERGKEILREFNAKFRLPKKWYISAKFAISEHMRPGKIKQPSKILELILKLKNNPIGADGFRTLIKADNNGKIPVWLKDYDKYLALIETVKAEDAPKHLQGEKIGSWIHCRQIELLKTELKIKKTL